METSKRIKKIISLVDCSCIADIGCDHGYAAVGAVLKNKTKKAYACDIAMGPLQAAMATIKENNVDSKVSAILSDGLENLPGDVEQVIIAGMGASTIIEILEAHPEKTAALKSFILSPHKDAMQLREYLASHGFEIVQEHWVQEGHFYPIMKVRHGHMDCIPAQLALGVNVAQNQDYQDFLKFEKNKWMKVIHQLPEKRKGEIQLLLEWIDQKL